MSSKDDVARSGATLSWQTLRIQYGAKVSVCFNRQNRACATNHAIGAFSEISTPVLMLSVLMLSSFDAVRFERSVVVTPLF